MSTKINSKGFTLIEILVGIALMVIIFLGLYGAFHLGLKVVGQSKAKVTAISLANQKMEEIRNLPYNDIGTIGGIPPGVLPETETIVRNSIKYTIKTTVLYVDDPFDELAPIDTLPTDYKRAKVKVSWEGYFGGEVVLVTDIAPKGVETETGGGTLKILVFNSQGEGVPQADIHIVNNQVSPSIDATYQSDDWGSLIIAGAPTSTEAYQITVTKGGYSQDRTYGRDEVANPLKPHATVFEGQITEISFSIDKMSTFSIETRARESFDDDFLNYDKISDYSDVVVNNGEVVLAQSEGSYQSSGFLVSERISPPNLINWGYLLWQDEEPEFSDIKYQLLYATGTSFELIPDEDLPGNSQGFDDSPVDISTLDTLKYEIIKIKGNFSSQDPSVTPVLFEWHLAYNTPLIGNVDFHLQGAKLIGTDVNDKPVYKYSKNHTSEASGYLNIPNLEWDSYNFSSVTTTEMELIEVLPSQPISLLPATTTKVSLYFRAENTLLVKVLDASSSEPIFGANVRVFNQTLGYDSSKPTDETGKAFFLPLKENLYNLEVAKSGYEFYSTAVEVSGSTVETVFLVSSEQSSLPPAAPTITDFTEVGKDSMTINWIDNADNEDGYRIYCNTINSKPDIPLATLGPNTTQYQATGLNCSTNYYWWVEAHNRAGESYDSADQSTFQCEGVNIYRSVGPGNTSPLATGASYGFLTISGTTAVFSSSLPDNIGVGDAIQYDSDGNGTIDSIAFIHGRTSATQYTVASAAGITPTPVSGDTDWSIFRAYTSLADAESGRENTGIDSAVRNFDAWSKGRDLVINDEVWNIALYGDATDTTSDGISIWGWTTGPSNYLRIYTPTSTSEVGVSQRHNGVWSTSAYRLQSTNPPNDVIAIIEEYVRIDGLQIFLIESGRHEGIQVAKTISNTASEIHISNNIIKASLTGGGNNGIEISSGKIVKVWNNILYDWTTYGGIVTASYVDTASYCFICRYCLCLQ